jgi:hypothetical protein
MRKLYKDFKRRMAQDEQVEGAIIAVAIFAVGFAFGAICASIIAWVW